MSGGYQYHNGASAEIRRALAAGPLSVDEIMAATGLEREKVANSLYYQCNHTGTVQRDGRRWRLTGKGLGRPRAPRRVARQQTGAVAPPCTIGRGFRWGAEMF